MSRWTHALCEACWDFANPGRVPARLKDPEDEGCCACGTPTRSGIYARLDPELLLCRGRHEKEEDG